MILLRVHVTISVVAILTVLQIYLQNGLMTQIIFASIKVKIYFKINTENLDNDYLTHCFSENMLYHFNRKRGMREYRDPVSNLFCVTFDNSSIMGQFYRDIQSIASSTLNQIYQKYVDDHYNKYYYFNKDTGVVQNVNFYKVGVYVGIRQNKTQNNFVLDGKFFIYHSGPFGDCTKTNAIKYMQPNERVTCGLRLVRFLFTFRGLLTTALLIHGIN